MKDVMGIAKPATGVQRFMSDGWEHSGTTMSRACFDWMKGGCARGDRCSYNHVPAQHKCLRNIHEPTRVKSKPRKHDHTKTNLILNMCNRENGQLASTRRRKNGGKKPMGRKQDTSRRHQGKVNRGQEQGGSKTVEGGGNGEQERNHRHVANEQREGSRCRKSAVDHWRRRRGGRLNSQLQIIGRGTKGGYLMRASGWRVLGTESQGTGACTMLWVVGKGTALKSSQGTKIVGQQDGGWVVSNAQKKKKQRKKSRHISAQKEYKRKWHIRQSAQTQYSGNTQPPNKK